MRGCLSSSIPIVEVVVLSSPLRDAVSSRPVMLATCTRAPVGVLSLDLLAFRRLPEITLECSVALLGLWDVFCHSVVLEVCCRFAVVWDVFRHTWGWLSSSDRRLGCALCLLAEMARSDPG
jgi:hypothetical protein